MEIRKPRVEERKSIIDLIHMRSQDAGTASLYCYQTYRDIEKEITWMFHHGHPFLGAFENNILQGIVYGFQVPGQSRIDVSGPFLIDMGLKAVADNLLSNFRKDHSSKSLHFYFEKANTDCEELLINHGAVDQGDEYMMQISRDACASCQPSFDVMPMKNHEEPIFIDLLERVMGTQYIDGSEIIADENRSVQLYHRGSKICGFLVLKAVPGKDHAVMEMIGIESDFQNQGLGRILLSHALYCLCEYPSVQNIELIVDAANTRALHLYTSMGFQIIKANKSYVLSA